MRPSYGRGATCAACAFCIQSSRSRQPKESVLDHAGTFDAVAHGHAHEHAHHEELGFLRKYVFSVDHKVIGIQYASPGSSFSSSASR